MPFLSSPTDDIIGTCARFIDIRYLDILLHAVLDLMVGVIVIVSLAPLLLMFICVV